LPGVGEGVAGSARHHLGTLGWACSQQPWDMCVFNKHLQTCVNITKLYIALGHVRILQTLYILVVLAVQQLEHIDVLSTSWLLLVYVLRPEGHTDSKLKGTV